jgi:serine O-acetyltransferase
MKQCPNDNFVANTDSSYLDGIVKNICATYEDKQGINHIEGFNLPSESEILQIVQDLNEVIFPGYSGRTALNLRSVHYNVGVTITKVYVQLSDQIARSFRYNCEMNHCKDCDVPEMSIDATRRLLDKLPEIRETMKLDVIAAFDGDPAARNLDEIVLSYPGIKAISIQRIAHELYCKNVPLIPRMMGEYAHRITGIDIHPGAKLGKSMFIDHGTGVVIGETSEIGNNVKIYQGVTLGALSFPKDACGKIIKGAKRHPTIEDDVTIYSGATILGNIVIGKGSLIGGNVWLTESVEPGTKVTISPPDLKIRTGNKKNGGQNA